MSPLSKTVAMSKQESAQVYAELSDALGGSGVATLKVPGRAPLDLPDALRKVLADAATAFARGREVAVESRDVTVTAQEAADILGVSRPTLVRILDAGKIPYERPGTHRRIRRADVVAYANAMRVQRREAMDDLLAESADNPALQHIDGFVQTR